MITKIFKICKICGICGLFTLSLASCNDWLDVEPKSQIKEENHFEREGGFKDQLTGIYTQMTTKSMYGLNMGIGFVEVLSHSYDINPNSTWRYANDFNYTEKSSEATISEIWKSCYSCIANANIVLRNIEGADPAIFTDQNQHVFRGEALGLRAFLHLELMRLFACAPSMDANAKGVPYVTEYSTDVVGQKSVGETMQLIIADLLKAHDELAYDTLNTHDYLGTQIYTQDDNRFGYYACCAALARAYMWVGDTQNALKYAMQVIAPVENDYNGKGFSWIHYTNMQQTNRNELDMAFTTEHLFQLIISDWEDIGNFYFTKDGGTEVLNPSDASAQAIYELDLGYGNDYRYLKGYEQDGEKRYMAKFWYLAGSTYNNRYPVIRMTEAWYIAAECQKNTNPKEAIRLLNEVRENRNLSQFPLAETLNADQIQEEIYKEYRKEFIGECGQLFFYYKRLNLPEIKGASVRPGKQVYVLPIPTNDQEFGGYSN
jgi:hypothetical protein